MIWVGFFIAFSLALALTPVVTAALKRLDVLDLPSERASHSTPTPRGGGLAIAVAALVALATAWNGSSGPAMALAVTATGFGLVGLVDDFFDLSPNLRLALQGLLGSLSALLLLADLDLSTPLLVGASIACVIWLMSFVNAFNFMDGINGLSVVEAVVSGAAWATLGWSADERFLIAAGLIQVGAGLGFAPYNFWRAKVFLGDVGSYFLGGWIAALAVVGLRAGLTPEAVMAPLAVYLIDTGSTLCWRLRSGHEWREPHRHHVYQRLTDGGWSHVKTAAFAATIVALCAALGGISVAGSPTARVVADIGLVLAVLAYLDWPTGKRFEPKAAANS